VVKGALHLKPLSSSPIPSALPSVCRTSSRRIIHQSPFSVEAPYGSTGQESPARCQASIRRLTLAEAKQALGGDVVAKESACQNRKYSNHHSRSNMLNFQLKKKEKVSKLLTF